MKHGLHYNRFRYFDPDVGMFISLDPIGLMGGNNVFQYAPNPIGWIDPFGLDCCGIVKYGNKSKEGLKTHHNLMDAWAKHNIPGYIIRRSGQPTIQLTKIQHDAAHSAERAWMKAKFGTELGATGEKNVS